MRRMPALLGCFGFLVCLPLVGGETPQETQKSSCKPRITHSGFAEVVVPKEGGTHEIAIKAGPSVKWTVRNDNYVDWITLLGGYLGTGPGTLTVRLEPNPGRFCRTGELSIAGIVPIYGLPIRILQEGTGAVGEDKTKEAFPSVIDLAPFAGDKSQAPPKREYRQVTKRK